MRKSFTTGALLAVLATSAALAAPSSIVTATAFGDAAALKSTLKQDVQYCRCRRQQPYVPYWAGPQPSYYYGAYPAYAAPTAAYYMAPAPVMAVPVVPAVPAYAPAPLAQPYAPS